jgi:hypothetical protein
MVSFILTGIEQLGGVGLAEVSCFLTATAACSLTGAASCFSTATASCRLTAVLRLNYNCIKRIVDEGSYSVSSDDIRQNNRRDYNKNNCRNLLTLCWRTYY